MGENRVSMLFMNECQTFVRLDKALLRQKKRFLCTWKTFVKGQV